MPGAAAMLPQEYAARRIAPQARGALAWLLAGEGLSQHQIARLLGTSQPAVHRYLSHPLEHYLDSLQAEGVPRSRALLILQAALSRVRREGLAGLAMAVNTLALQSSYCRENECDRVLCGAGGDPESLYRLVLDQLARTPGLHELIPEVGSNLAYAPQDAESLDDVIGLDGRIVKTTTGRVYPAGSPVRGGSRHVGQAALKAAQQLGEAWALALRGSREVVEAARRVAPGLVLALEEGEGVEPVLYLASRDPWELLEAVENIIRALEEDTGS